MFNRNKVSKLEKENQELINQISKLESNYNEYAKRMGNKIAKKDREYHSLQKKYLTVLDNSVQRDKKTGKYIKNVRHD